MAAEAQRNTVPPPRRLPFSLLVTAVTGAAAVVAVLALSGLPQARLSSGFWLMAGIAAVADARPFTPPGRRRTLAVFPSVCLTFAVLLGWGLGAAIAVQAAAVVVAAWRMRHAAWRAAYDLSQYTLALAAAELVLWLAGLRPYPAGGQLAPGEVAAVVAAAAAWFAVRYGAVVVELRLRSDEPAWPLLRRTLVWEALTYGALLLLGPVLVAAAAGSPALVPLVVVPLYAVYRMARLAEQLAGHSRRDPLTGLANRPALAGAVAEQIRVHRALATRGGHRSRFGLLVVDLDRFKNVNDALGHEVGDQLLVEVGARLAGAVGPRDLVARLGGDEFAVLVPRLSGAADARAFAGRMVSALSAPVRLQGLPLDVSGSIGVAVWPEHGGDVAELLRRADVAMYDAKHRAAAVAVYTPETDHHTPQRLSLLADLRTALAEGPGGDGVVMHYQPQVAVATGEVVGVEALLRWHHPTSGPVPPDQVIKVAEHTAVMRLLTLRIIDEVVAQVAAWARAGVWVRASVNVSIRDLHTGDVAERVAAQLRRCGVPAGALQLEITEGALMADPRRVMATIAALDRLGVAISLDDFGTGYSSLQHLRRLPLAEVKIDRSFVLGMSADDDDAAIVRSIVELSGALGLRVVAEGVEDAGTASRLAEAGCHVAQGWYYARPMPADELLPWLAGYRRLAVGPGSDPAGRPGSGASGPRSEGGA